MQNKQNLILIIFSILLLSCASLLTNCAPQNTENSRTDEPTAVVMQAASETPADLPKATNTVEPSLTNTLEPTPTFEPTPTEVMIIDYQDTFMHRANLSRTGVYQSPGPKESPKLLWKFAVGDSVYSAPAIFEGVAYFGSNDGNFYAVDISTGEELWAFTTGGPVLSSPALADGILYFGSNDGQLYALDASSGEVSWSYDPGDWVVSSPAVSDGLVYFGSYDGFMHALNAQSGEEVWRFEVEGIIDADNGIHKIVKSSPAISEGVVFFSSAQMGGASAELFFYGLDARTGEKLWEFTEWNQITSSAVYQSSVYFGGFGSFYGLDVESGNLDLVFSTEIVTTAPAICNGVAYFGTSDGQVFALDISLGEELWRFNTGSWEVQTPSISDGILYLGSGESELLSIDTQTGEILWKYDVGERISTPPVISGGVIFFGTEQGHLFALN